MLLSNQFWGQVFVQLDLAKACPTHLAKDRLSKLGLSWVVWKQYAAEYLQVADAGTIGLDPWSDKAVLLHVLGPVFLVFRGLRNRHLGLPHSIECPLAA